MRGSEEITRLITDIARSDDRIRAVLLNGSRANNKISPDKYQDFDIVYVVDDIESFVSDKSWADVFGRKLIWQLPDEMVIGQKDPNGRFSMLMLFTDGNRIDLTLLPKKEINANYKTDSLTVAWLDKDNIFSNIGLPNDSDYLVKQPAEKEFLDTCNEFWWVCTYVAKGLVRNEIIYSKEMLEMVVRPMFMNIVAWYIGIETNFSVSVGKGGKFMKDFLPPDLYKKILQTYSDQESENNWKALFLIMDVFGQLARTVSHKLKFRYIIAEEQNVVTYVSQLYKEQSPNKE
jgi:aminoglycoside 6-adenylyltransferase